MVDLAGITYESPVDDRCQNPGDNTKGGHVYGYPMFFGELVCKHIPEIIGGCHAAIYASYRQLEGWIVKSCGM